MTAEKLTQIVILAGGLGTRMKNIARNIPKNLIPIHGKPFAHYQLSWIRQSGLKKVLYCIGHLGDQIRDYAQQGAPWGLEVNYTDEGENLQGTAGALRIALQEGKLDERFLLIYGDSFLPIDFSTVARAFVKDNPPALMTVFKNQGAFDQSNVIFENGMIRLYTKHKRPEELGLDSRKLQYIDYGLMALKRETVAREIPPIGKADLAELFYELSLKGELAGLEVHERFYEIGSPRGLKDLEDWVENTGTLS